MIATDNPVLVYIQQLWRDMLRIDVASTETSFYELGGDSMLMVEMLVAVSARFQCEIDYEEFLSNPTISYLTRLINEALAGSGEVKRNG